MTARATRKEETDDDDETHTDERSQDRASEEGKSRDRESSSSNGSKDSGISQVRISDEDMCARVHTSRRGHMGVARTVQRLAEEFPGHKIPVRFVEDYIARCPTCQKFRLARGRNYYREEARYIPAEHLHSSVGVDLMEMREDPQGNKYLCVVVCHFSKMVRLFPMKDKTAETVAKCMLKFYAQAGIFDLLRCDPGAEFTADVVKHLHSYLGIPMRYSLVRRHESSGVERTNREVRRHLMAILADEEKYGDWSEDTVLPLVEYVLNSEVNHETGEIPLVLQYGTKAALYHRLPSQLEEGKPEAASQFVRSLDEHLERLRENSRAFHLNVQRRRAAGYPVTQYQETDLVLFDNMTLGMGRDKMLDARWAGPFQVIAQEGNAVKCTHVNLNSEHEFHVSELKLFQGDLQAAQRVARFDKQQFEVRRIQWHKGDPSRPTTLVFRTEFADGDIKDIPYCQDIQACEAFAQYCRSKPYLEKYTHMGAARQTFLESLKDRRDQRMVDGAQCWVNIQCYNADSLWADKLLLPDQPQHEHWLQAKLQRAPTGTKRRDWNVSIDIYSPRQGKYLGAPYAWLAQYVTFERPQGVIIDADFAGEHPQLYNDLVHQEATPPGIQVAVPDRRSAAKTRDIQPARPEEVKIRQDVEHVKLNVGDIVSASQIAGRAKNNQAVVRQIGQGEHAGKIEVEWTSTNTREWLPATSDHVELMGNRASRGR